MLSEEAAQERRNEYDVTNTVRVSSAPDVREAIQTLFWGLHPTASFDAVWLAFHDFERLYLGLDVDYHGVDTSYHDMQHSLDVTLAVARLVAGHDMSVDEDERLGPERAVVALVAALFHDSGYLRHKTEDQKYANGAELTQIHVSRSGRFLEHYLPQIGLAKYVPVISRIMHFTGYELSLDAIALDDPKDIVTGQLLGTGDLVAQLADRCYLEKCRDRLFPEFVLGGLAFGNEAGSGIRYRSGQDLLSQTLKFYEDSVYARLESDFNGAYRYLDDYFEETPNPYIQFIRKNLSFLSQVLNDDAWDKLRRRPPCSVPDPYGEARLMALASKRVRERNEARGSTPQPDDQEDSTTPATAG